MMASVPLRSPRTRPSTTTMSGCCCRISPAMKKRWSGSTRRSRSSRNFPRPTTSAAFHCSTCAVSTRRSPTSNRAIELEPERADYRWNLALMRLRVGDFDAGWLGREWGRKVVSLAFVDRKFEKPRWQGEPIAGKTILLAQRRGARRYHPVFALREDGVGARRARDPRGRASAARIVDGPGRRSRSACRRWKAASFPSSTCTVRSRACRWPSRRGSRPSRVRTPICRRCRRRACRNGRNGSVRMTGCTSASSGPAIPCTATIATARRT